VGACIGTQLVSLCEGVSGKNRDANPLLFSQIGPTTNKRLVAHVPELARSQVNATTFSSNGYAVVARGAKYVRNVNKKNNLANFFQQRHIEELFKLLIRSFTLVVSLIASLLKPYLSQLERNHF
jgi:hypothetical protein